MLGTLKLQRATRLSALVVGAALFASGAAWAEKFDLICVNDDGADADDMLEFVRIKLSVDTNNTKRDGVIVHTADSADAAWTTSKPASLHPDQEGTWEFFHLIVPAYAIPPNEYSVSRSSLQLTADNGVDDKWYARCRKAPYSG